MDLAQIMQTDRECYMNTFGSRTPVAFTHGKGATLYDTEGNAYTDFVAGIAVSCLGYGDEGLAQAISQQAARLIHCSNLFFNEPQTLLAEKLHRLSGSYRVFFCNSGAEANECAIKLARKFFYARGIPRFEIISARNSFHGRTLATVAATGQEKYQKPYAPLPAGFVNVPYRDFSALQNAVTDHTAAILLETIQGEGGVIEAGADYLLAVSELCRQKGILLILDEVQTGMGRTGKLFSFEHFGIRPDIFSLAKGLGGGVPIGATLARPEVAAAFNPGDHGTTFGGNPLACAAGNYVVDALLTQNLIPQVAQKGAFFLDLLKKQMPLHPCIADVRGKGLLIGLQLKGIDGKTVVAEALKRGWILNCAGGNTLRFAPPFVISETEIRNLIAALDEILTLLEKEKE